MICAGLERQYIGNWVARVNLGVVNATWWARKLPHIAEGSHWHKIATKSQGELHAQFAQPVQGSIPDNCCISCYIACLLCPFSQFYTDCHPNWHAASHSNHPSNSYAYHSPNCSTNRHADCNTNCHPNRVSHTDP
jgi:hypothetical protein